MTALELKLPFGGKLLGRKSAVWLSVTDFPAFQGIHTSEAQEPVPIAPTEAGLSFFARHGLVQDRRRAGLIVRRWRLSTLG